MTRRVSSALALALGLLVIPGCLAAEAEEDIEARKAKIVANLMLQYPQLEAAGMVINTIEPSPFAGLDQGNFTVGGRQNQEFLVSTDDTKFYMIAAPIDVSRSTEQIQAEMKQRKEEEAQKSAEAMTELDAMIASLPMRGNASAPITIVEFSDFQCPYCSKGAETVEQLLEKYPNDLRFVFMQFPLGFHPWAKPAAIASNCAAKQSSEAFWSLHDSYFANQQAINPGNVMAKSKEFLAGTGIDLDAWSTCAEDKASDAHKAATAAVDAEMALGSKLGVQGTPGFFVNGRFLNGAVPLPQFEAAIAEAKAAVAN